VPIARGCGCDATVAWPLRPAWSCWRCSPAPAWRCGKRMRRAYRRASPSASRRVRVRPWPSSPTPWQRPRPNRR